MSVRRNLMNVVRNYTDAEIKVREATSNDPWGPSSVLMSEIADLTYNVVAFSEIMTMVWKRINDHGKNWRHVYKALTVLDYLIKTGTERVATQCKENIFAIQTLKDFQFIDRDGKDQGLNVREKSKQLVNLLKDDERLKKERIRALKVKERFSQSPTGISSDNKITYGHGRSTPQTTVHRTDQPQTDNTLSPEIEQARPTSAGEEELQLQLALAMSKEEADQQQKVADGDSLRLKMAIHTSEKNDVAPKKKTEESSLFDLSSAAAQLSDPWGNKNNPNSSVPVNTATDNFGLSSTSTVSDPWGENPAATTTTNNPVSNNDPWDIVTPQQPLAVTALQHDPWGTTAPVTNSTAASAAWPNTSNTSQQPTSFDLLGSMNSQAQPQTSTAAFDFNSMNTAIPAVNGNGTVKKEENIKSFLGSGADLVNLDNLIKPQTTPQVNPFAGSTQVSVPMGGVMAVPVQQQTQIYPQFGNPAPQSIYNTQPNLYNTQPNFIAPQMAPNAFGQTQQPPMMQQPTMMHQPMYPPSQGYAASNINNSAAQNNPFLL